MKIEDVVAPEDVLTNVSVAGKMRLLKSLSQHAAERTGISIAKVIGAITARERLGSTGLGRGIAIPHAGIVGLPRPFGLFARLQPSCDFEAIDEQPVDLLCMFLVPEAMQCEHVNVLSRIARRLGDGQVAADMRVVADARGLYCLLTG